jgi:hypothetical protein
MFVTDLLGGTCFYCHEKSEDTYRENIEEGKGGKNGTYDSWRSEEETYEKCTGR